MALEGFEMTQVPLNNPTLCESVVDGKPCGGYSSYIYKTATTTRLICDECARKYRAGGPGGGVSAPIFEFSLLELVPARQVLMMKVSRLERVNEKMRRLAELSVEERNLLDRHIMWEMIGCAVAGVFTAFWAPAWAVVGVFVAYGAILAWSHHWVYTTWRPKEMEEINKKCGFPEMEQ
jgi:hypothetical protein